MVQLKVDSPPIPTLLAVGALHHHLIRTGMRTETSIVADTAQCVSTHQLCTLIGYGVHAVCPYLAFETARQWRSAPRCAPGSLSPSNSHLVTKTYLGCKVALLCRPASRQPAECGTCACRTDALVKSGKVPDVSIVDAQKNYKKALEKGVLKILSKVEATVCLFSLIAFAIVVPARCLISQCFSLATYAACTLLLLPFLNY